MTRPPRLSRFERNDDGRIALLALVLAFAVLLMIGLSVDGGGKIRAMQRADNVASEAARAAVQGILAPQAIEGGDKVVDPAAAVAAAQNYLAAAGVTGVVDIAPDRKHVTVTVTITYTTLFLGLIGINSLTATGHATTVLVAT
ncbi:pilus assembly protein TadG-related protein [Dactylosporangium sp. NPDC000244]|uniref:pilus assembly protein TadG-related protein n=1 Tax=Dactylosporangium sp. NPDC000244 TaxID=3154365 RepID=UPI00331C2C02